MKHILEAETEAEVAETALRSTNFSFLEAAELAFVIVMLEKRKRAW